MSTKRDTFNQPYRKIHAPHTHNGFLKSAVLSLLVLAPALLSAVWLVENRMPLPSPYLLACAIVFLAVIDFVTILMIEPYRRQLGAFTIPAFIGAIAVVLAFLITEAINRFFEHLGYGLLTPFVIGGALLLCAGVICEKNVALKCQLSLNSVALALLWTMGDIDKITMPF